MRPSIIITAVLTFAAFCPQLVQAQLAAEISPSIENRITDSAAEERRDLSMAPDSGGGSGVTDLGNIEVVRSEFGYTFTAGSSDFSFGDEITPPLVNIDGEALTIADARNYWRLEPVRLGEAIQRQKLDENGQPEFDNGGLPVPINSPLVDTPERYYYSPHREALIASHFGRIEIVWVTALPDEFGNFQVTNPTFYTIGASSSLQNRSVYWTEVNFKAPRVQIPNGFVEEIKIIHNDRLPEMVADGERVVPSGVDAEVVPNSTVWFDANLEMIRAYNREGRVLIEYLGAARPEAGEGVREHLGLEVINVSKILNTVTVSSTIGEQLLPARSSTGTLPSDVNLIPVQVSSPGPPVAQHFINNRTVYYGIEENLQPPRAEFYWLEPSPINGTENAPEISWPVYRNNYFIRWPEDVSEFEAVFARPNLGTDPDIISGSFIDLKATNTPELLYQDDPTGNETSLDFQFHLSVDLDTNDPPVNRSLIRFNSGNEFWYVRIYSATTHHLESLDTTGEFDAQNPLDFHITPTVNVGERIEPPHSSLAIGGYINPLSPATSDRGLPYQESAYINPFAEGGIEGANLSAIIPVNALPGNDQLRIWWFRKLEPRVAQADLFSGIYVPTVIGDYTITYPEAALEIVMASNKGTGELDALRSQGEIYWQNDSTKIGYNPNEEHAITQAGRAYALRDDLNIPESSEPFVLLAHSDEDGRPDMTLFKVLRENEEYKFDYPAIAGRKLGAPFPLPIIPQPLIGTRSRNIEVTSPVLDPALGGTATNNIRNYNRFTFQDRKGDTWIYRGRHAPDTPVTGPEPKIGMHYYYPTLDGFWFPSLVQQPEVGSIEPYLRPVDKNGVVTAEEPLTIFYEPLWPEVTPVLHFGETLAKTKFGLPQILGASSAQLIYQQSIAKDVSASVASVVLHDATIDRVSLLADVGLDALPSIIPTTSSQGKIFFQNLPSHLEDRVYVDPLIGTAGALVFQGRFVDELAGEDYLLLNTLSVEDRNALLALHFGDVGSAGKTEWANLIAGLKVTPEFRYLDGNQVEQRHDYDEWLTSQSYSSVVGQNGQAEYGPHELPHLVDPDQVKNDYALTAVGGGSGYVTLVFGNGEVNTDSGDPVQMSVFRVGEQLYRGELKSLVAANPLSENVTVQHAGDFAARESDYTFEWKKAAPVNGQAPPAFGFENVTTATSLSQIETDRNGSVALPFVAPIYESGQVRTSPGLALTADLDFTLPSERTLDSVYLSLKLTRSDGAIVKVNGIETLRYQALSGENSEVSSNVPSDIASYLTNGGDYVVFKLSARDFQTAATNSLEVLYNTTRADGVDSTLDLRIATTLKTPPSADYITFAETSGKNRHVVSGSGIDTLGDNYYIMRYKDADDVWSDWTSPALVEGWIKRVLAGINPFNQRVTDFFENAVNTNVSILSQAGSRWEGDIALNLEAVQDVGLIEIYETVLKRGINLSINGTPSVDYAPANDALLLAAGYLNDLYVALGNEAFADAANPTVSFDGQALGPLGDASVTAGFEENFRSTSTARFAFQGQVPTLLEEELALLRGRDDSLSPSIQTPPVYNRMFWNYTRGIDAGELIYALNYNISEESDEVSDGKIDAADAARMFPQAHGDAYGHYLTAVKNYYRLLTDPEFTWGTRIEAVNVLGQPVAIDYFDERKFAASAAALARTADQVVSLERRRAFQSGGAGWSNLSDSRADGTRFWGVDDWAARSGQGAYFHWVVGNTILPELDEVNEGIQKIDRTTVPELDAIAKAAEKIQGQLEAADARVNPLDLSEDSLLFDISPNDLANGKTHFEQILARAEGALKNANAVFTRAADSTRLLRSLENQSQNLTQLVDDEERAFGEKLIAIFGLPFAGDIGAGKIYDQGYEGPDLLRYMAIDRPFDIFSKETFFAYDDGVQDFVLNVQDDGLLESLAQKGLSNITSVAGEFESTGESVTYRLREDSGIYLIAEVDLGKRGRLGSIQGALNEVRLSEEKLYLGLADMSEDRENLFSELRGLEVEIRDRNESIRRERIFNTATFFYEEVLTALKAIKEAFDLSVTTRQDIVDAAVEGLPMVVGLSSDTTAPARGAILAADVAAGTVVTAGQIARAKAEAVASFVFLIAKQAFEISQFDDEDRAYLREQISNIEDLYASSLQRAAEVDALSIAYIRAQERYRSELSKGQSILANRETFRRRAAAAIQGYRTRDIAFRTFRSEALEEYQTLFDWASKYAFLAAQAYDYETGLLGSTQGQQFMGDIISSRALGVVGGNGEPMLSASANGDPGLSGLLAKLSGDYDVVKGRLGFNNPETNGTTVSLRREYFRIPDGPEGDIAWQQKLEALVTKNLLADADIAAFAMQLDSDEAQPGFLLNFPTNIEAGKNFFGKSLLAGDSDFSTTSFATKVHSLGVVFEGYQGMAPCVVCASGAGSPTHNHDDALSATPDVFLIPTGLDTMRTPPLGGLQVVRTWSVQDYAMPLPFDLGASEPTSTAIQDGTQTLQAIFRSPRRHPSFRATDREDFFYTGFAQDYTSSRLVGRSVWNSSWKLAIPAKELLADEGEGIARFIRSVKDIKLHLKTYSYSGN